MNTQPINDNHDVEPKPVRQPLGRRDKLGIESTLLRVMGRQSETPALDVAAFNSFAD